MIYEGSNSDRNDGPVPPLGAEARPTEANGVPQIPQNDEGRPRRLSVSTTQYDFSKSGRSSSAKKRRLMPVISDVVRRQGTHDPLEMTRLVQQAFGASFLMKPFQHRAVRSILDAKNTCVIAGTGTGKSMCFQALALRANAIVLVVSPLNRLETEQVCSLLV